MLNGGSVASAGRCLCADFVPGKCNGQVDGYYSCDLRGMNLSDISYACPELSNLRGMYWTTSQWGEEGGF